MGSSLNFLRRSSVVFAHYVKSLGKVFDCSLRDAASTQATNQELEIWLTTVDKSGLPGKFKA